MSSDCSHKEFVIWSDTHRVQWYKRNSELRSEIWPPSKPSTQKEFGLCICRWDESMTIMRQALAWHLGLWANNVYSVALRWSDYVTDNVDVQCIILSAQCWTANTCLHRFYSGHPDLGGCTPSFIFAGPAQKFMINFPSVMIGSSRSHLLNSWKRNNT